MVAPGVRAQTMSVPRCPILNSVACSRSTAHTPHTSPPSLTHTHSPSESTGTTHRSCCQSSAQRIVPAAVLLVAVTVVNDMDESET